MEDWISLLALMMGIGSTAFLQAWSTTVGLQIFDMLLFVPTQVALQILITTGYGLVFFEEVPLDLGMFAISTAAVVAGVLTMQSAPEEERVDGYMAMKDSATACTGPAPKTGGSHDV